MLASGPCKALEGLLGLLAQLWEALSCLRLHTSLEHPPNLCALHQLKSLLAAWKEAVQQYTQRFTRTCADLVDCHTPGLLLEPRDTEVPECP